MFFSQEEIQFDKPVFETGLTPTDIQALLSLCESELSPNDYHDSPNSVSEGSNSNSNPNSTRMVYTVDERKKRRKQSNRESARRSRMKKKRHIENLTAQLNRFEFENRELKTQLGSIFEHCRVLWRENNRLTTERLSLQNRLSDLSHVLVAMHAMQSQNPPLL